MSRLLVSCSSSLTTSLASCSRFTSVLLVSARPILENPSRSSIRLPILLARYQLFAGTDDSYHRAKKMPVFAAAPSTRPHGEVVRAGRGRRNRQTTLVPCCSLRVPQPAWQAPD